MRKTLIIAEAGVNHNGNTKIAKKLIDVAAAAGADFVKFQTFKADKLVTGSAGMAAYQSRNTGGKDQTQLTMLRRLELSFEDHVLLREHCEKKKIGFLSTAFDEESIEWLCRLDVPFFKIPSGEITNLPYLRKAGSLKKKVILSTGMAEMQEVEAALEILLRSGTRKKDIILMHCNTEYPTPMEDVNLLAMCTMAAHFRMPAGYSDHTPGIEIPIAAVALGAVVIEKHFTLSREMQGPDHKASLQPSELKQMVIAIRNIEKALGDGQKRPSPSESRNRTAARRSIHISRSLSRGSRLRAEDLVMKRPGDGISPMRMNEVTGKKIKKDMPPDYKLRFSDLA